MREPSTEFARVVLTNEGFAVADIDVAPGERRADLRVSYGAEEYLVEAKLRSPHQGWLALMRQVAAEGYATAARPVDPWNSLSSTILEAYEQLTSTPAGADVFRVLWVAALHDDGDFVIACLEKRLLGTQRLVAVGPNIFTQPKIVDCYHHAHNDFQRCQQLHAAVVGSKTGARLLVNYFSPDRDRFRRSRLHAMFSAHGAVVDAEIEVERGEAFMLGDDFSGMRDGPSQWSYIRDRYGCGTSVMVDSQFAGVLSIPREVFVPKVNNRGHR